MRNPDSVSWANEDNNEALIRQQMHARSADSEEAQRRYMRAMGMVSPLLRAPAALQPLKRRGNDEKLAKNVPLCVQRLRRVIAASGPAESPQRWRRGAMPHSLNRGGSRDLVVRHPRVAANHSTAAPVRVSTAGTIPHASRATDYSTEGPGPAYLPLSGNWQGGGCSLGPWGRSLPAAVARFSFPSPLEYIPEDKWQYSQRRNYPTAVIGHADRFGVATTSAL